MANKYIIDAEQLIEERRRQDLIDLLRVLSEKTSGQTAEYIIDVDKVSRFNLIKKRIHSYFAGVQGFSVESSIDDDCIGGLITITSKDILNLELTEEIKLLIENCTRMDISPRNNGIIDLEFNFLGFRKKRLGGNAL